MHLSESNLKCVYVATGFPKDRFAFAQMVTIDEKDPTFVDDEATFQINGLSKNVKGKVVVAE